MEAEMPEPSPTENPHGPWDALGRLSRLLPSRRLHSAAHALDRVVVRLTGEITSKNAGRIGRRLQDVLGTRPTVLEIDLGRVTYLSRDGGAAFFMALRAAREHSTRVIITHVRSQARRTLHELGLERVVDVYAGHGPSASQGGDQ
ncbi:STAS domain-containing protein [Streptomyces sp. NPDC001401]|uniref:STAS domain-containing protein n=1 Tax=Streptomyces sp. NPDC001401 TaxID=3364570 RepID=UPI003676954C